MTPKWYPTDKEHVSLFCQQKSGRKTIETQFFDSDNESEAPVESENESEVQDITVSESNFSANETNN